MKLINNAITAVMLGAGILRTIDLDRLRQVVPSAETVDASWRQTSEVLNKAGHVIGARASYLVPEVRYQLAAKLAADPMVGNRLRQILLKEERQRNRLGQRTAWLMGAVVGAVLMYLFDPLAGKRRRARLRKRVARWWEESEGSLATATGALGNRAENIVAGARSRVRPEDITDTVLAGRVRAAIGRVVAHPAAISLIVNDGYVTLGGPISPDEVDELLAEVHAVRGVAGVENRLELRKEWGDVPGPQRKTRLGENEFDTLYPSNN